jgi:predicted RNase H-like HicB family nuclease
MTRVRFTAVFERHGRWYVGYLPELPGVNAQERTLVAARRSLSTALRELAKLDPAVLRGRGRRIEQIEIRLSA